MESNRSSIGLLLRSNDDDFNQREQGPSVCQPFGLATGEECLLVSHNGESGRDQRSLPAPFPSVVGFEQFSELDSELLSNTKRDVWNIQPLQPSPLYAFEDGNLSDEDIDRSLLLDAVVGLSAEGFVDKYESQFADNDLCDDGSSFSDQPRNNESVCKVVHATAQGTATPSFDNNDNTILTVNVHNASSPQSDPTDNRAVDTADKAVWRQCRGNQMKSIAVKNRCIYEEGSVDTIIVASPFGNKASSFCDFLIETDSGLDDR